jgi:hypothetical protein
MIRSKQLAAAAMQLHSAGNFLGAMQTKLRIGSEAGARLVRAVVDVAPHARCFRYQPSVALGLG